jgi:sorbitol-6-phosphate 2-dehydrogenase
VIVNVSSESGLEGSEGQSCYAATKAALNSFTRSWSKELGKHGIRVVGVAPGIRKNRAAYAGI